MLKNWCIYILLVIAGVVFFLVYQMWLAWYCLLLLLFLPLVSLIFLLVQGRQKIIVDAPKNVKLHDKAEIGFHVEERGKVSLSICRLYFTVRDVMGDKTKNVKLETHPGGALLLPIETEHCGAVVFDAKKVRFYDLFKLFFINKNIQIHEEVLVRPVPSMPKAIPQMNGFKAKMLRKSSSTYSEIYDVRDYVEGDPVKNIHWKLSAKKDRTLIKEPQEECYGHARVYLSLLDDRKEIDQKLGELVCTSSYFLEKDIMHRVRVLPPKRREVSFDIQSQRDLDTAIIRILHMRLPKEDDKDE